MLYAGVMIQLKIKVGASPELDVARLTAIRQAIGDGPKNPH